MRIFCSSIGKEHQNTNQLSGVGSRVSFFGIGRSILNAIGFDFFCALLNLHWLVTIPASNVSLCSFRKFLIIPKVTFLAFLSLLKCGVGMYLNTGKISAMVPLPSILFKTSKESTISLNFGSSSSQLHTRKKENGLN